LFIQANRLYLNEDTSKEINQMKDKDIKYFYGPLGLLLSAFEDRRQF